MTTNTEIRDAFWNVYYVEGKPKEFWGKTQNELPEDLRLAFFVFVDYLQKEGTISKELASKVTL